MSSVGIGNGEDRYNRYAVEDPHGLVVICLVAAVAGTGVGVVTAYFRKFLFIADGYRESVVEWAHRQPGPGWLIPIALVVISVAIARAIVILEPRSSGSGVHDLEAVWRREAPPTPSRLIPAKFIGGLLAMGSGLALGREGPSVQMGAAVGSFAGRRLRLSQNDLRVLQTALGGAGLSVAFNAPIGGAVFIFEEVATILRPRLGLPTLIGTSTAITTSWLILGNHPDFDVGPIATPPGWTVVVFVLLGILTGFAGVIYNQLIIWFLALADRVERYNRLVQPLTVGAIVGILLWFDPLVASAGGDPLTQKILEGGVTAAAVVAFLAIRFLLSPLSYSAQTAGGLFAPLLTVGALWGAFLHLPVGQLIHTPGMTVTAFAIVGMSAFFAATVRAPFSGIVLVIEMTAATELAVPMLAAAFGAGITAALLRGVPIEKIAPNE